MIIGPSGVRATADDIGWTNIVGTKIIQFFWNITAMIQNITAMIFLFFRPLLYWCESMIY
jgi:hypothetical protein